MKRILVTGGAGFIGINLVDWLFKTQRFKITILDDLSTGNYTLLEKIIQDSGGEIEERFSPTVQRVCFYKANILDKEAMLQILKGQHQVIHLAAQTGVISSQENPDKDADVNIIGTLNLLNGSVRNNIEKFIFASSAAPLGFQLPPFHENLIPKPLSPYGASKLAGEAYCSAYHGSFGLRTVILRFSNVYGPNSHHKGSVVAHFIKKILGNKPLTIYGDGGQTRDFLYVGDIIRIIEKILDSDNPQISGEIFQLGTAVETSINQLVKDLKEISGVSVKVDYLPQRKGEIFRNFTSIEKIKNHLGYKPQFDLRTGLKNTWQWFREVKK